MTPEQNSLGTIKDFQRYSWYLSRYVILPALTISKIYMYICLMTNTQTHTHLFTFLYFSKCYWETWNHLDDVACGERNLVALYSVFTVCLALGSGLYSHFLTQPPRTLCGIRLSLFTDNQNQNTERLRNLPKGTKLLAKPGFEATSQGSNIYIHMQTQLKIKF